MPVLSIFVYII